VIGRYLGTVVVTIHGDLDLAMAAYLAPVLTDLIDGQGNLSIIVDLHHATTTDAKHLLVFRDAAERVRRRGGAMTLSEPPPVLQEALRQWGLDYLVRDFTL
jgi:anti-anti-sigma factor